MFLLLRHYLGGICCTRDTWELREEEKNKGKPPSWGDYGPIDGELGRGHRGCGVRGNAGSTARSGCGAGLVALADSGAVSRVDVASQARAVGTKGGGRKVR